MLPNSIIEIFENNLDLDKEQIIKIVLRATGLSRMTVENMYRTWRKNFNKNHNLQGLAKDFEIVEIVVKGKSGTYRVTEKGHKPLDTRFGARDAEILSDELNLEIIRKNMKELKMF